MLYFIVKLIHILLAIVAVGFNASYGVWLARSDGKPELSAVLQTIRVLDNRFANPAYGLLLLSGLLLVFVGHLSLTTVWIDIGLGLWVVLIAGGVAVYSPTLRRQIQLAEAGAGAGPEYAAVARRGRLVGMGLGLISLLIVADMVLKP